MPRFVIYLLAFGLLALAFAAIARWSRGGSSTVAASTNRLLFAIVLLLFAVVFKLVSNGMDGVVLLIALVGLGVGWSGMWVRAR